MEHCIADYSEYIGKMVRPKLHEVSQWLKPQKLIWIKEEGDGYLDRPYICLDVNGDQLTSEWEEIQIVKEDNE